MFIQKRNIIYDIFAWCALAHGASFIISNKLTRTEYMSLCVYEIDFMSTLRATFYMENI